MPYDDSNIKKMIKYQTERKVGFSRSKRISDSCKQLVHFMLEADISLRYKITQVQAHSWLDDAKLAAAEAAAAAAQQLQQQQQQQQSDKQPLAQLPAVRPTNQQAAAPPQQPLPVLADRPPLVPYNNAVANTAENNNNGRTELYERKRTYDSREKRRKSNTFDEPMDIQ